MVSKILLSDSIIVFSTSTKFPLRISSWGISILFESALIKTVFSKPNSLFSNAELLVRGVHAQRRVPFRNFICACSVMYSMEEAEY